LPQAVLPLSVYIYKLRKNEKQMVRERERERQTDRQTMAERDAAS